MPNITISERVHKKLEAKKPEVAKAKNIAEHQITFDNVIDYLLGEK